ncbi:MAG: murein hydrolase activator EnvC family protein [Sulfuriferula sp.]
MIKHILQPYHGALQALQTGGQRIAGHFFAASRRFSWTGRYLIISILSALSVCWLGEARATAAPDATDLATIHAKIQQLQKQNHAAQSSKNQVADALQQSERAISAANRNLLELDQQHKASELALDRLHAQMETARTAVTQQQRDLSNLLRQQYFSGHADGIKLLMSNQDPNQIARNLIYFAYIGRARNQLIYTLQQNLNQLNQFSVAEQQQQIQLDQQRQQREDQRRLLQAQRQQKQQILRQLGTQIQAQHQQIATLEQNEKRITKLLHALARAAAERKARAEAREKAQAETRAATHVRGHMRLKSRDASAPPRLTQPMLPDSGLGRLKGHLILPTRGELIHRFGTPRELGGTLWKGLFIKAPAGQPVRSVADGQVVFADWLRGFGNLIIIDHGGGYMSLYSDNETLYKRVGDNVKAGDVIASVGNTGGNSETGLYFELRYQSQAFDPSNWIAR